MNRRYFLQMVAISAALTVPVVRGHAVPQNDKQTKDEKSQDKKDQKTAKKYHDEKHGKDYEWNADEDRRYRQYLSDQHQDYRDFDKLNHDDQQGYWDWRYSHND